MDDWTNAAETTTGFIFRAVSRTGAIWGEHITPKAVWHVVKGAARSAGIANLAPHDLRRYAERRTMPHVVTDSTSARALRGTIRHSLNASGKILRDANIR